METVKVTCGCGAHKNIPDKPTSWQCPSCSKANRHEPNTVNVEKMKKAMENTVEQLTIVAERIKPTQKHKP